MADTQFKLGIQDCKVAAWTNATTWGTAVDVPATREMTVTGRMFSKELEGDDQIADVYSRLIAAQVQIQFGFKSLDVLSVLTGMTHESSSNDDAMSFIPQTFPFFAVCGRVVDSDGVGNDIFFVPKCKIMSDWSLGMSYDNYVTPQMTLGAVSNGSPYYAFRVLQHAAATVIAIPPTAIPSS